MASETPRTSCAARRVATMTRHLTRAPVAASPSFSSSGGFAVAILGAAGGIGQPLSLLMKRHPMVTSLRLFDVAPLAKGVAADVSHVDSAARVDGFVGDTQLGAALHGADVVLIPAGVPRKPGMTRDDLFNVNAGIVRDLTAAVATHAPAAILLVISNPVNSTVPIAAEVLKTRGVYDPKKLMGVTHLDVMRARTFVADAVGGEADGERRRASERPSYDVPVVGGHAGVTILPLLSQTKPFPRGGFSEKEIASLTNRIQNGGTEVVEAKAGAGSATLSMAAAAAEFADLALRGLAGERGAWGCAYVDGGGGSEIKARGLEFFASKVRLGRRGVEQIAGLGRMTPGERVGLEKACEELRGSIAKGKAFVAAGGGDGGGAKK